MYIRRKMDAFLEEWKSDPARLPLIIRGAKQVGKTESVLHFAKSYEVVLSFIEAKDPYSREPSDGRF